MFHTNFVIATIFVILECFKITNCFCNFKRFQNVFLILTVVTAYWNIVAAPINVANQDAPGVCALSIVDEPRLSLVSSCVCVYIYHNDNL
jgi:hypothetical protein